MRTNEIKSIGNELAERYEEPNYNSILDDATFKNRTTIFIFDEKGTIYYRSYSGFDPDGGGGGGGGGGRVMKADTLAEFFEHINENESSISYVSGNEGKSSLVFGKQVGKSPIIRYFYLESPMDPNEYTVKILSSQLTIITAAILTISTLISLFISLSLSKPILGITSEAEKLSHGDYSVKFKRKGIIEIDSLADTLNNTTSELAKTEDLRRDLLANITHDLKTPLTLIQAYAEMMRDLSGNDPIKRNEHANIIIDETSRLTTLVNDILLLSKLQAGAESIRMNEINLSNLCNNVISHFKVFEKDGYNFVVDVDQDLIIMADTAKIEQVLYNLIGNSVNYTGPDKKVYISLKNIKDTIRFSVKDTGKGIPDSELDYIWDKYYRAEKTSDREIKGTGIGLSIVKVILQAHNFTYGVDTQINHGSTFYVDFTIKK